MRQSRAKLDARATSGNRAAHGATPLLSQRHLERKPLMSSPQHEDRTRGRVLVVDDELPLCEIYADMLAGAGCKVETAATGREAVVALARGEFDLVVSDIRMPDLDGIQLLRVVRERDLDLPVILITGSPSLETALHAIEHGVLRYLVKLVAASVLCAAVERGVRLCRLARLKREALTHLGDGGKLLGDHAGLETTFDRALSSLWLAAQPIVRSADGALFAHEVLVRTRESLLPNPGSLFGAAERLGRTQVLGRAIRGIAADLFERSRDSTLFVNVNPLDLADDDLLSPAAPLTKNAGCVILEITERAPLEGIREATSRIRSLRALGYRLALDDLGAGYAGLSSFAVLEPEIVKLDMSLIRGLDGEPVKQKLVRSFAQVCHELGTRVIAEGVETPEERDAATRLGCDLIKGLLIGRPAPWPDKA